MGTGIPELVESGRATLQRVLKETSGLGTLRLAEWTLQAGDLQGLYARIQISSRLLELEVDQLNDYRENLKLQIGKLVGEGHTNSKHVEFHDKLPRMLQVVADVIAHEVLTEAIEKAKGIAVALGAEVSISHVSNKKAEGGVAASTVYH